MPIIRIPQAQGVAPQSLTPTQFEGARAAYDASEKRRRNQAVAGAINAGLNAAGQFAQMAEKEDAEKGREEISTFLTAVEVKKIQMVRDMRDRMRSSAFNPDQREAAIQEMQGELRAIGESYAGRAQSQTAREGISTWMENDLLIDSEVIRSRAYDALGNIEFEAFEGRLIDRVNQDGDWADKSALVLENYAEIMSPVEDSVMEIVPKERDEFLSRYVQRPLLDAISDGLSNLSQVREIAKPVLDGAFDAMLGDQKWEARKQAENAVLGQRRVHEVGAASVARDQPLEDQGAMMQLILEEAEADQELYNKVADPAMKRSYELMLDGLRESVSIGKRIEAEATAFMSGSVASTYSPYEEVSMVAAGVYIDRILQSPAYNQAAIPDKAAIIADALALTVSAPPSFQLFVSELAEALRTNQPGALQLTNELSKQFAERGLDLTLSGISEMIVAGRSAPSVSSGTNLGGGGGSANIPRETRDVATRQANRGDFSNAILAVSAGNDLAAVEEAERQTAIMVAGTEAMKAVDSLRGPGTMQRASDNGTRLNLLVSARIAEHFSARRGRRRDEYRSRRAEDRARLEEIVTADEDALIARVVAEREERIANIKPTVRDNFSTQRDRIMRESNVQIGQIKNRSIGERNLIRYTIDGQFGEEAQSLAMNLKNRTWDLADARGWDPENPSTYNQAYLSSMAATIIDDALSAFPDYNRRNIPFETAINFSLLNHIESYGVSRFSPGKMIDNPPEFYRPNIFEVWQNEFNEGGKLAHLAESKDAIVENVSDIRIDPDTGGWVIDFIDPTTGIPRTIEDYVLLVDDDNYMRMLNLDKPTGPDPLTVAAKEAARAQMNKAKEQPTPTGPDERERRIQTRQAVSDFITSPPSTLELAGIYLTTEGYMHPIDGGEKVEMVMQVMASEDPLGLTDAPLPSSSLIKSIADSRERYGRVVLGRDEVMEIGEVLGRVSEWTDAKTRKLLSELPDDMDPEERRVEENRILTLSSEWQRDVKAAKSAMSGIVKWWNTADSFGFKDHLTGEDLYEEVRLLNLYSQMEMWRKWRGMPVSQNPREDVREWIGSGGLEDWLSLPTEVREAMK